MDEQRVKEVFADEAFVKSLFALETPEEARDAFRKKGLALSAEEVLALRGLLIKTLEKAGENGGELSVEELDEVAGGVLNTMIPAATAHVIANVVNVAAKSLAVVAGGAAAGVISYLTRW